MAAHIEKQHQNNPEADVDWIIQNIRFYLKNPSIITNEGVTTKENPLNTKLKELLESFSKQFPEEYKQFADRIKIDIDNHDPRDVLKLAYITILAQKQAKLKKTYPIAYKNAEQELQTVNDLTSGWEFDKEKFMNAMNLLDRIYKEAELKKNNPEWHKRYEAGKKEILKKIQDGEIESTDKNTALLEWLYEINIAKKESEVAKKDPEWFEIYQKRCEMTRNNIAKRQKRIEEAKWTEERDQNIEDTFFLLKSMESNLDKALAEMKDPKAKKPYKWIEDLKQDIELDTAIKESEKGPDTENKSYEELERKESELKEKSLKAWEVYNKMALIIKKSIVIGQSPTGSTENEIDQSESKKNKITIPYLKKLWEQIDVILNDSDLLNNFGTYYERLQKVMENPDLSPKIKQGINDLNFGQLCKVLKKIRQIDNISDSEILLNLPIDKNLWINKKLLKNMIGKMDKPFSSPKINLGKKEPITVKWIWKTVTMETEEIKTAAIEIFLEEVAKNPKILDDIK